MAFQRKILSAENALVRLETMCARAEHCSFELSEKLRGWGVGQAEIEKILEKLREARYFDDNRYAHAYARDKLLYNRWGKRKIAMGLRSKHIDSDVVADALQSLDEMEYRQVLSGVLRAKARSVKEGNTYEGRTKVYRAGIARGFEPQLVTEIIRNGHLWDYAE